MQSYHAVFYLFYIYLAIFGTNGSSGFGSVNNEHIDNNTFEMVNAGDQLSLIYLNKYLLIIHITMIYFVVNLIFGGLNG